MKTHELQLTTEQLKEVRALLSSAIAGAREVDDAAWSKEKIQFLKGIKGALKPLVNPALAS